MTLTAKQEAWIAHKAAVRAERASRRGGEPTQTLRGRAERRKARHDHGGPRRSRRMRGKSLDVDRGVFNIATGQHAPLPRL